jgi:hypothetical protein
VLTSLDFCFDFDPWCGISKIVLALVAIVETGQRSAKQRFMLENFLANSFICTYIPSPGDFHQFSSKKFAVFSKTNVEIIF